MFATVRCGVGSSKADNAWRLGSAVYASKFADLSVRVDRRGLFFSADGTKLYAGDGGNTIHQYSLSTAWDSSTYAYVKTLTVTAVTNYMRHFFFSSDGTKLYTINEANLNVNQYSLSTAWDTATASDTGFSVDLTGTLGTTAGGLFISSDGTKLFSATSSTVYQFSLSTAWAVASTNTTPAKSFNVSAQSASTLGITFSTDGTRMYTVDDATNAAYQYNLSTAWDVSTASYASASLYVGSQETFPTSISFSGTGKDVYILGVSGGNKVYQYTIG